MLAIYSTNLQGQFKLTLADEITKSPVTDALAFIDKTSYSLISRSDGSLLFDQSISKEEVLNISHLNYHFFETPLTAFEDGDTVFLAPVDYQLANVQVVAKSSRKRKRWLREFEDRFLGVNARRYKVSIKNPEVLLFEEDDGELVARANGPITIFNEKLAYETQYWLESYRDKRQGSVSYNGKYFISDLAQEQKKKKKIFEEREKAFASSSKNLLKSLLDRSYEQNFNLYQGRFMSDGSIEVLRKFDLARNLEEQEGSGLYTLKIRGLLYIEHRNIKARQRRTDLSGASRLGQRAEADMIQHEQNMYTGTGKYETSQLLSNSEKIVFDAEGNMINTADIQEYGYWGTLGMADVFPNDPRRNPIITTPSEQDIPIDYLVALQDLLYGDEAEKEESLISLENSWSPNLVPPLLDLLLLSSDQSLRKEIGKLLEKSTGRKYGSDYYKWLQWLWQQDIQSTDYYSNFRADLYRNIDEKFDIYFRDRREQTKIRLDEVVWGGVKQDGIPPLRQPNMILAKQATYLNDDDVVFGISIGEDIRAYPKRILAWHEFFTDKIGNKQIAGVYCTLCGTVIAYDMVYNGVFHNLGTSGFLYRSNKLMYDKATQSLWSTIEGKPVVGPLVDQSIELESHPVVTTTWGEWKEAYPSTLVLSLETGHNRDYSEGAAYRDYYSTDNLMFPVPKTDKRLKNKHEVFVLKTPGYQTDPIAFSIDHLKKNPVVHGTSNGQSFVIVTTSLGSRAYESLSYRFTSLSEDHIVDEDGNQWIIDDDTIRSGSEELQRLPGHRIFWFAWYNAFPETTLVD